MAGVFDEDDAIPGRRLQARDVGNTDRSVSDHATAQVFSKKPQGTFHGFTIVIVQGERVNEGGTALSRAPRGESREPRAENREPRTESSQPNTAPSPPPAGSSSADEPKATGPDIGARCLRSPS